MESKTYAWLVAVAMEMEAIGEVSPCHFLSPYFIFVLQGFN